MNRRGFLENIMKGIAAIGLGFVAKENTVTQTENISAPPLDVSNGQRGYVTAFDFYQDYDSLVEIEQAQETIYKTPQGAYVTISGLVRNVNTAPWSEGESLWGYEDLPGNWANIETANPSFSATVMKSHAESGIIFVQPTGAMSLDDRRQLRNHSSYQSPRDRREMQS